MINSVIACLFLFLFGAVLFVVNATAPFAPRNEGIRICGQGGAKRPAGVWAKMHLAAGNCVKILLPETKA